MGLYLCIAQIDLEGSPRRLVLCTYDMNEMQLLTLYDVDLTWYWLYVMNMLLVWIDIYEEEHAWYEYILIVDITYDPLLGLLDYVGLWGFT